MHKVFPCLQVAWLHLICDVVSLHAVALLKKFSLLINFFFMSVLLKLLRTHIGALFQWAEDLSLAEAESGCARILCFLTLIISLSRDNKIINPLSQTNERLLPLITYVYQRSGVPCQHVQMVSLTFKKSHQWVPITDECITLYFNLTCLYTHIITPFNFYHSSMPMRIHLVVALSWPLHVNLPLTII